MTSRILRHHKRLRRARRALTAEIGPIGLEELIGKFAGQAAMVSRRGASLFLRDQRRCRGCGCTESRACIDSDGLPCCWVEVDLCSACAPSSRPYPVEEMLAHG